jgi:serine/threonine protein kinase
VLQLLLTSDNCYVCVLLRILCTKHTAAGHIKVIDFGTCKDLETDDLNGPEFVGTAQYMSPQAVASKSQVTASTIQ